MKTIKRISGVLHVVGVVLLCFALVASIYAAANYGAVWSSMRGKLAESGVETNFLTKIKFDNRLYSALSAALADKDSATTARAAKLEKYFADFASDAEANRETVLTNEREELLSYFENEFDYAAFLERYNKLENGEGAQEQREIFEYLDSLTVVLKKGKLNVKPASCAPWFSDYYGTFAEEHGEEAGTYLEFLTTVRSMIETYVADGNKLSAAKDYMTSGFTYEAYVEELAKTRAAEKQESVGNALDDMGAWAQAKTDGESVDVREPLESTFQKLKEKYSDVELDDWNVFLVSMKELLAGDAAKDFDGSFSMLADEMRTQITARSANAFGQYLTSFCRELVTIADASGAIGMVGFLWGVVAQFVWLWVAGIVLLVLAKVLTIVLTKRLLKQREKAGIQEDPDVLLRVSHLKQYFRSGDYVNKAVDDVSFYVKRGEVFGLVGESGCGKTTTGRTIINLYDPTEGDVYFEGLRVSSTQNGLPVLLYQLRKEHKEQLAKMDERLKEAVKQHPEQRAKLTAENKAEKKRLAAELKKKISAAREAALESSVEKSKANEIYREKRKADLTAAYEADKKSLSGKAAEERKQRYETEMKVVDKDNIMTKMQMIFQDPIASINPRMTVREIIAEGLEIRGVKDKEYIDKKVYEMLELVGLVPEHADRYPHEFSGGQRQRIGIARAIVMQPDLIIADEPISALDVSIQAQVINLLNDLRNRMGLTIMFIAHNLSVVKYFSDRIAVMYYGKIVEMTTSDELFAHPLHPYTKALLSAIPYPDPHYEKQRKRIEYNPTLAHDYSVDKPSLREITPGHYIHCNDAEFKKYQQELGIK